MVFKFNRSIFPLLPPYRADEGFQAPPPYTDPDGITPYLGLKSRLSQIWINRWTVLILLVLVRLVLAVQGLQGNMDNAQVQALAACTKVESMGSAMASMPHYMSQGVNELTASGITKAVNGLVEVLQLLVTGVEGLVVFFINMMVQTYLCLITLVVRGSIDAATSIVKEVTSFLDDALPKIGNDITKAADGFQKEINGLIDKINKAASLFSDGIKIPKLDLTDQVDELKNLKLPPSINDAMKKLNSSVPTFDEVKNATDNAIKLPFELLKKKIDEELGNYTFDASVFPVPEKEKLSFCGENDGINDFFDGVASKVSTAQKVFIAVLVIAAVLVCLPMAYREIRTWRAMRERSLLVRKEAHDPMDVVYIVSRPYTSTVGIKAASWFSDSRRQILVRWVVAYATSTPALFLLSLGVAGLLSCLCQYILLRVVQHEVPGLAAQVGEFADKVVASLDRASEQWAVGVNKVMQSTNDDINDQLFGWVNTSTTSLNDTLNTFLDKTHDLLDDAFGGTPLEKPVRGIFNCLVELKVESIQKGLTWVHDHAHIDMPQIPNDTFSVGAAASIAGDNPDTQSFLANPGDATSDQITEVVVDVTSKLEDSIRTEAIISGVIVLAWVLLVFIGIFRALIKCVRRERPRGVGGVRPDSPSLHSSTDGPIMGDGNAAAADRDLSHEASVTEAFNPRNIRHHNRRDSDFHDQKLGFAGQRDYSAAISHKMPSIVRGSAYVEYDGDEKHH
ncbi:hypothetical protein VTN49DRAFT_641 [Thermomyces lanuginosus]|uniref:uncharacterized protein n=1 Tax=Thermomyces lanuginosus TaxID=5541 RepID=UPI003741FEA3